MQTNVPDTALQFEEFSHHRSDSRISLEFKVTNTGDAKLYEFVKLYLGSNYIGLQYLDLEPGESSYVEFPVDAIIIAHSVTITTSSIRSPSATA
ncbi:MAG: hypothetical protein SVU32_00010, partial [Candidatus Nanohaloarchaea archaeon]|nr:hypothetical protein [Candidatus Nanohaloarchaea archaeon]